MKNFIILLPTVFILSCATAPPQILNDKFLSSQPDLQVQFHKPIVEKSITSQRIAHGDIKQYFFFVNNTEGILIQILTYIPSRSGIEFYGPQQVLTSWGCMALDSVVIDGDQWIKYVDVFNNEILHTGYFRIIMEKFWVSVARIYKAGSYAAEIGFFQKGASLSYGQGKVYDEAFAHTDQLFSIGRDIEQSVQATDQPKEKPKVAAIPKEASIVRLFLRRQPMEISSQEQITRMLVKYNFFDFTRNPHGSFVSSFVDNNDGTVTDKTTGLMWQRSGSTSSLENRAAKEYIEQLNRQRFAGYSDWRMPTVEELASLLHKESGGGIHMASVFENKHSTCWTADQCDAEYNHHLGVWIINFKQGQVQQATFKKPSFTMNFPVYEKNQMNYVKAVRSVK